MPGDAVGTEEEGAAVFDFDDLHVGFDGIFGAQGAANHVFARMVGCLLRSHPAGAHFFFDNRMVVGFAMETSVRRNPVKARIADVPDSGAMTVEMERDHRGGHHRETRIVLGHLVNRAVGPLNRKLHQVFDVITVTDLVLESVVQNIDRGLRSDFAGLSATHPIGDHKNSARSVNQIRIFIQRPLFAEAAIGYRANFDLCCSAHSTASRCIGLSGSRVILATARASCALRCEKAMSMPSIPKLVIRLKPPWLTNGKVMPVIGRARVMPPMLTSA